jgi:hypothetical protein
VELVRVADCEAVAGITNFFYRLFSARKRQKDEAEFNDARNLALLRLEQWQADFRNLPGLRNS